MTITAKPRVPTDFRLASGAARSRVAHVSVAPLVRFRGMPDAATLRGYARPVFPGASVALQRLDGSSWTTVARATIDENGSFEARSRSSRATTGPGSRPAADSSPASARRLRWDRHEATRARDLPARVGRARLRARRPGLRSGSRRVLSRAVAQQIEARTGSRVRGSGRSRSSVGAPRAAALGSIRGVAWVERFRASRRLSFTPNDPLAVRQWYLDRIHASTPGRRLPYPRRRSGRRDRLRASTPTSGAREPDRRRRSFVPSSWQSDTNGHGTFVAGEIAASVNNAQGIAGIGFPAELLIAKVVRSDGTISPDAEARGDPLGGRPRRSRDQPQLRRHSRPVRQVARHATRRWRRPRSQYAVSNGVLVVAAVGNAGQCARPAVGLRRLPGGAAARAGGERRSRATARCRPSRTGTASTTTSPLRARTSSRRCRGR